MVDPFLLDRPAVVSFSGGRTSGLMLWRVLQAFGGTLPADVALVFCNTGKERPETLDFVREVGERWGVAVTWLEYRPDAQHKVAVVNYDTASREGRPFADLIGRKKCLPNPVRRFCTGELKVKTANRYARHVLGWTPASGGYTDAVGLRADEPGRVARLRPDPKSTPGMEPVAPLAKAGMTLADVEAFWAAQPFDLRLRQGEGNCDLCLLKSTGKLLAILDERPDLAGWWIAAEAGTGQRFRKDRPGYAALLDEARRPGLFPLCRADEDDLAECRCTD